MIEKITLDNGLTVVLERMQNVGSASVGIFVKSGSLHETKEELGIAHFIEHMLFKGTETRSARQIAEEFDDIGGQVNAFTSKELTCFYAKVLGYSLPKAILILSDMLTHSKFDPANIKTERNVVREELSMYEDSPEDLVCDSLLEKVWSGSKLAYNILGTAGSIRSFNREMALGYMRRNYTPSNMVVSIAGSFERDEVLAALRGALGFDCPPPPVREEYEVHYEPSLVVRKKDIEQNHLCLGVPGLPLGHPKRFELAVLSNILGEGMSSRLFQRLREEMGLVYTVYTFLANHEKAGFFGIYSAQTAEAESQAIELIRGELESVARDGVTDEEVRRAKELLKTNIVMGYESSFNRMNRNARDEIFRGRFVKAKEITALIDAVDTAAVSERAGALFEPDKFSLGVVGRTRPREEYRRELA
ncbi:M16 family metallopeptidase [Feifania hominis]|uniref:Insulinase family protein n=1 Tax=Feifania hominis TaxID=2763660 RepID=A0A926DDK7_9FIRM|nr:pitrilysin family protein [Feifania hominis]MBC8536648.1 insulinase family protein [Feifania hominis]